MIKRGVCLLLSLFLVSAGVTASAAVVSTHDAITMEDRQQRVDSAKRELAREDVKQAMVLLGVDPAHAQDRVDVLSDAELTQLSAELEELPAGGGILGLIGGVFVVLLILELTGVIDIFKKL